MSYDRQFVEEAPASRRTTARGGRCGRWGSRRRRPATTGTSCWRGRCSSAALPAATELGPRGTALDDAGPGELRSPRTVRWRPPSTCCARWRAAWCDRYRDARHRRLALVRADADLRQRPDAAGAVPRARRSAGDAEQPARRHRVARSFSRRPAFGTIDCGWSATPGGITAEGRKARRRRAADRRRGVRARLSRRLPGHRRSPLPAPDARGVRLVPRGQPPGRLGLRLGHRRLPRRSGRRGPQPEPGGREHDRLPAVADGDAGARGRRTRIRRPTASPPPAD